MQLPEIFKRLRYCLRNQVGFSLIRVGDAENQVMAQGSVYTIEDINNIWWANDENWTGIVLPNFKARDRLIASVKEADIVGVLHQSEEYEWKHLSEEVFAHYIIKPRILCYAFINVYMLNHPELIALMKMYRVLLIGKASPEFAVLLKSRFDINVAGTIIINNYFDIPQVLHQANYIDYELALISAGSNAVILATALAQQGKVAVDFGSAMKAKLWEFPEEKTGGGC